MSSILTRVRPRCNRRERDPPGDLLLAGNLSPAVAVILRERVDTSRSLRGILMRRLASRPAALVVGSVSAVTLLATSGVGPASASSSPPASRAAHAVAAAHHPSGKVGHWKVSG